MSILSSQTLKQNIAYAKHEAEKGPVYITHRGKPEHVFLTLADYLRLKEEQTGKKRAIADALSMPGLADIEFDPPRLNSLPRAAEFD